jgi:hypothetical protein
MKKTVSKRVAVNLSLGSIKKTQEWRERTER